MRRKIEEVISVNVVPAMSCAAIGNDQHREIKRILLGLTVLALNR